MAFKPSEMTFAPSSVRYCCPHCDQQYFGTDGAGHLVPQSFDCVRCGKPVTMDEMVIRPIDGVATRAMMPDVMPWLERSKRGTARAWFQTIGRAMVAPASLMRAIPADASGRGAWKFMLASIMIFFLVGMAPAALFSMLMLGGISRMAPPSAGAAPFGGLAAFQAANFVLSIVMLWVGAALWMVLTHGLLRLFGGATESASRTWLALGYSSAASALMAIPCGCGYYPGVIWWIVAACIMLGVAHPRAGARAAWACIVSAVIVGALQFAVNLGFTVLVMGGPAGWIGRGFPQAGSRATVPSGGTLAASLTQFAQRNGKWPDHGLELLGRPLQPLDFSATGQSIGASAPAVGATTLAQLESRPADWSDMARDAAESLPADVVAHRVGDVVFTYHDVPAAPPNGALWVAVLVPQTVPGSIGTTGGQVVVILADGQSNTLPAYMLPAALAVQNDARTEVGLPPLPLDLAAVSVDRPAQAGQP